MTTPTPWWEIGRPTGDDRARFLTGYVEDMLGEQSINAELACFLALGANRLRCDPPLPDEVVLALADEVAAGIMVRRSAI
jgi:hypothetical protein